MVNTLIKFLITLFILINLYTPKAMAYSENFKQCFYLLTESTSKNDLNEDLKILNDNGISTFILINPNEHIKRNIIDAVKSFENEENFNVLIENTNDLENSYFGVKGYDEEIRLSGLYNIENNKFIYSIYDKNTEKGNKEKFNYINNLEKKVFFNLIEIGNDPLEVKEKIDTETKENVNYALLLKSDSFNISTLILAYNSIEGIEFNVYNYEFTLNKPSLSYLFLHNIGNITMVFFSLSIFIFFIAIIILKKWSVEKFLG